MEVNQPSVSPNSRFTVKQAARIMGVCDNTMRNWIREGVFKSSEHNKRAIGHKATFVTGAALIRIWNMKLYK